MYFCSGLSSYMLLLLLLGLVSPPSADESIDGLSGVTFEDNVYNQEDDEESTYQEFGLCIPQDRLEDVDFSPRFDDDYIRLPFLEFDLQDYNKKKQQYSTTTTQNLNLAKKGFATRDYAKVVLDDGGEIEDIGSNVTYSQRTKDDERSKKSVKNNYSGGKPPLSLEHYCDYPKDVRRKPRTEKSKENQNRNRTFEVIRRGVGVGKKRTFEVIRGVGGKKRTPVMYLDSLSSSSCSSRERKRICTHCQAEDTPQWRLGPSGPNTLCNACGLRYKVGRLVENYRPAASPSFNSAEHSNFYKRIMRKKIKVDD